MRHLELGRRAEDLVASWLSTRGYRIVDRNVRLGRLEIDIVAQIGKTIVFCEVRARRHAGFMNPEDSVTAAKIKRLQTAARQWLANRRSVMSCEVRFDVASVVFDCPDGRVIYFDNAF